jgi:hypothetical protein
VPNPPLWAELVLKSVTIDKTSADITIANADVRAVCARLQTNGVTARCPRGFNAAAQLQTTIWHSIGKRRADAHFPALLHPDTPFTRADEIYLASRRRDRHLVTIQHQEHKDQDKREQVYDVIGRHPFEERNAYHVLCNAYTRNAFDRDILAPHFNGTEKQLRLDLYIMPALATDRFVLPVVDSFATRDGHAQPFVVPGAPDPPRGRVRHVLVYSDHAHILPSKTASDWTLINVLPPQPVESKERGRVRGRKEEEEDDEASVDADFISLWSPLLVQKEVAFILDLPRLAFDKRPQPARSMFPSAPSNAPSSPVMHVTLAFAIPRAWLPANAIEKQSLWLAGIGLHLRTQTEWLSTMRPSSAGVETRILSPRTVRQALLEHLAHAHATAPTVVLVHFRTPWPDLSGKA